MNMLSTYHRTYAEYNSWANEAIIAAILKMPDNEYYQPIFPKSLPIHQILNHVLVMDKVWLGEVRQVDVGITSGMQILHETKHAYIRDRRAIDIEIAEHVDQLTARDLRSLIRYDEPQEGFEEWPMMLEVAHIFRHQIHHRGQVSVLMQNSSVEAPKLDGLFLPQHIKASAVVPQARAS
jgi:uncharacterized damage-inducible protein DinB